MKGIMTVICCCVCISLGMGDLDSNIECIMHFPSVYANVSMKQLEKHICLHRMVIQDSHRHTYKIECG